ncbi:thiamine pyrophosphate-binding protein [Cysteiniphilum halobium]|uniref:thiamine pyrophosphate-binding protein n=1 Tax=Cysteiniphilum halobium TaxID=2219059 RepID=UPI003F847DDE
MNLGDLLIRIAKKLNIETAFGVPGDYVMSFLDYFEKKESDVTLCGTCNELNAGYAADAYARMNGYGMVTVTSGPGEMSLVNAIAGSYAENIPVLMIVGCPNEGLLESQLPIHHSLGNFISPQFNTAFNLFTSATANITRHNTVEEIIRVVSSMIKQKKPVYLNIPVNLFDMDVSEYVADVHFLGNIEQKFMDNAVKKVTSANHPLLIIGNDVKGSELVIKQFIENHNIPYVSTYASKGIIGEDHPLFCGIFAGNFSTPTTTDIVKKSDCVISIGTLYSDFTSGEFTSNNYIDKKTKIVINRNCYRVGKEYFALNIDYDRCLENLFLTLNDKIKSFDQFKNEYFNHLNNDTTFNEKLTGDKLTHDKFWQFASQHILKENDIVIAEAGCSLFGMLPERIPKGVEFISQPKWSSIGYTLPAALGASVSKRNTRTVLFIGDGSFHLSAQELSTISALNLNVCIFIINNDGYTIEREIHGANAKYNDVPKWDHIQFAHSVGVRHTLKCENFDDLSEIDAFLDKKGTKLVELLFDKRDKPKLLKSFAEALFVPEKA